MIIRCHRCGAEWTSLKWEHCTVCCQTFAATRPGDGHRVGPYSPPGGRRCLEPREMEALGMWTTTSPKGVLVWHGRASKAGLQRRRFPEKPDNTPEEQQ